MMLYVALSYAAYICVELLDDHCDTTDKCLKSLILSPADRAGGNIGGNSRSISSVPTRFSEPLSIVPRARPAIAQGRPGTRFGGGGQSD
jgi:hypothetical protein